MKKTVFVIGAGASAEYGLPLGPKLATLISEKLRVEAGTAHALEVILRRDGLDSGRLRDGAKQIAKGVALANSIDEFLETYKDFPELIRVGKSAIASVIANEERGSRIGSKRRTNSAVSIDFSSLHDTWMVQFMKLASRGVASAKELFKNITFVVFNYDRCLEHFFLQALPLRFGISETEAIDIVRKMDIWHPYGHVAALPKIDSSNIGINFGELVSHSELAAVSTIRIYSEEIDDIKRRDIARYFVGEAQQIVFLGCALHKQNLELIQPGKYISADIYATAFKASDLRQGYMTFALDEFRRTVDQPEGARMGQINVANMTCTTLLAEFGPTIFG